jgi:regulator of protease activity HflC (stomatin/prohibitin superfamily)
MVGLIILGVVAFVLFIFVANAVKIVHPYQRALVEQLGRYKTTVGPGLKMIARSSRR